MMFIATPVLLLITSVASGPAAVPGVKSAWQPEAPSADVGATPVAPVFGTLPVVPFVEVPEPFEPLFDPDPFEPFEPLFVPDPLEPVAPVAPFAVAPLPEEAVPVTAGAVPPVTGTPLAADEVPVGAGVTVAGACVPTFGVSRPFAAAIPVAATAVC